MDWDAVGAIAEMFGAFGVIATLLYLATQIRQSKKLLDDDARFAAHAARTSTHSGKLRLLHSTISRLSLAIIACDWMLSRNRSSPVV